MGKEMWHDACAFLPNKLMKILYVTGKYLTFPGAYLKALWEHLFCRILHLPIERADYLLPDEGCGHVEHAFTRSRSKNILLCLLSASANILFGLPLFLTGFAALIYFAETAEGNVWLFALHIAMLYLGASLLCNLAPLPEDSLHLWETLYRNPNAKTNAAVKVLLFLPVLCLRVCAFLERCGLNIVLMLAFLLASLLWL